MTKQDATKAKQIGARIRQARKEAGGMTQRELGDLLGVTERSVAAYEAGEVVPYRFLRDLERVLGVEAAWLLHGDDVVHTAEARRLDEMFALLHAMRADLRALRAHESTPPLPDETTPRRSRSPRPGGFGTP